MDPEVWDWPAVFNQAQASLNFSVVTMNLLRDYYNLFILNLHTYWCCWNILKVIQIHFHKIHFQSSEKKCKESFTFFGINHHKHTHRFRQQHARLPEKFYSTFCGGDQGRGSIRRRVVIKEGDFFSPLLPTGVKLVFEVHFKMFLLFSFFFNVVFVLNHVF